MIVHLTKRITMEGIFLLTFSDHYHIRLNNPGRVEASVKIFLQTYLFLVAIHQLAIFTLLISSSTTSIQIDICLLAFLLPVNVFLINSLSHLITYYPLNMTFDLLFFISGADH